MYPNFVAASVPFPHCCAPATLVGMADVRTTFAGSIVAVPGIFQIAQWVELPDRSCRTTAKLLVLAGAPVQCNSGDVPAPERVISVGRVAHDADMLAAHPAMFIQVEV